MCLGRKRLGRTSVTDRQTKDIRQTDGRQHIANVNVSWRSLKIVKSLTEAVLNTSYLQYNGKCTLLNYSFFDVALCYITTALMVAARPVFAGTTHFLAALSRVPSIRNPGRDATCSVFSITPCWVYTSQYSLKKWKRGILHFARVNFLAESTPEDRNLHLKFQTFFQG